MSHKGASGTKVKKTFLTLVVLALLAVALQSLVFSGASFTSSSGTPGNVFTAGTFGHTNTKAGVVDTPADPGLSNALTLRIEDITGAAVTLSNLSLIHI